jgi:hypothetical protein
MNQNIAVYVVKPRITRKYKKLCKEIYRKYKNITKYSIDDNHIDIPILMNIIVDHLKANKNINYARNVKYTQMDFIKGIIDILNNNTYWSRYKGIVPGKYLNKKHNEYCKIGVYECMYRIVLHAYQSQSNYTNLKYQTIDSTFVRNLYGTEMLNMNAKYKNKKGIKVSFKNDQPGVPLSIAIGTGSTNDAKIAYEQLKYDFIELNTNKVKNNNRYKQYIYGDAAYHSNKLHAALKKKGYTPVTDVNIRNTKDETKLKQLNKLKRRYLKTSKRRATVEHSFAWFHKYAKLNRFIEKTIKSYVGLMLLGCSIIANNKMT